MLGAGPPAQWRPSAAVRTEAPLKQVSGKINISIAKSLCDAFSLFFFIFSQYQNQFLHLVT